jgi:hypothetical protein
MKYLFPLLACILLVSFTEGQTAKNDWTKQNLKDQVKSVTDTIYKAVEKSGVLEKDNLLSTHNCLFNEMGFDLGEGYKKQGKITSQFTCKYDSRNNLAEKEIYKDEKLSFRETTTYDEKNNPLEKITLKNSRNYNSTDSLKKKDDHYTYKYDAAGNIIEISENIDGVLWVRFVNIYDGGVNIVKQNIYYPQKPASNNIGFFKYDAQGNQVEKDCFNADSVLVYKFTDKYDAQGNHTESAIYRRGDTLQYKEMMTYDDRGNVTRVVTFRTESATDSDHSYEFKKFDSKGNWHEQVQYSNGKPETITERTIEYY